MSSEQQSHRIHALNGTSYTNWSEEMALFCSKGLWCLVGGQEVQPAAPAAEQLPWDVKQDKAAGELMLNIAPEQRFMLWG
ncbi:hypothetical protein HD554DRAFT_2021738, partial [Boletus coccyginus]